MKRVLYIIFLFALVGGILVYKEEVTKIYFNIIKYFYPVDSTIEKNEHFRDYNFSYLQNTTDFEPNNMQDVINIFYTVINSGQETFSFYCPDEYPTCTDDVKDLANNQTMLSHINNFVHPYNGFKHIETQYNSLGKVTITVFKSYDLEKAMILDKKVDEIISSQIKDSYTEIEKIRVIHNYIINNSKYDVDRSEHNIIKYDSDTAYGPLIQGYGICGGYSDAMQLFLEKFGIKNYKVASESHIWNAVFINNQWYHLDLTWDDPITPDGVQILDDDYFLISSNKLMSLDTKEHFFDNTVYSEVK